MFGDALLGAVGREGVYAGEVNDPYLFITAKDPFFLFHRDARPVADRLVGACEGVE